MSNYALGGHVIQSPLTIASFSRCRQCLCNRFDPEIVQYSECTQAARPGNRERWGIAGLNGVQYLGQVAGHQIGGVHHGNVGAADVTVCHRRRLVAQQVA